MVRLPTLIREGWILMIKQYSVFDDFVFLLCKICPIVIALVQIQPRSIPFSRITSIREEIRLGNA